MMPLPRKAHARANAWATAPMTEVDDLNNQLELWTVGHSTRTIQELIDAWTVSVSHSGPGWEPLSGCWPLARW